MGVYDIAIIGGGVVGCAILHELTLQGYNCVLVERNASVVSGASSGNSGMFHTGFDAAPNTLEFEMIKESQSLIWSILHAYKIPYKRTGAIMVATDQTQLTDIRTIYYNAQRNGVTDAKLLAKSDVEELEPNISSCILGGLLLPSEMVIDSCLFAVAMAHHSIRRGAKIYTNHEVSAISQLDNSIWQLKTNQKFMYSKVVINAAGLYGDNVDRMGLGEKQFSIQPRKGEFVVFNKEAGTLIKHIILPVPTERTKGVIIFPSVYGNLVIGPTATDTIEKEKPSVDTRSLGSLADYGFKMLPMLKNYSVSNNYVGVRPATQFIDFQIVPNIPRKWLTVGGIRSTGVTACLGISQYVHRIIRNDFNILPSKRPFTSVKGTAIWWKTDKPSYVLDGMEYSTTHKLMNIGLQKAKL